MNVQGGDIPMFMHIDHGVLPVLYTSGRVLYIWLVISIMVCYPCCVHHTLVSYPCHASLSWYLAYLFSISNGIVPSVCMFIVVSYPRYAFSSRHHIPRYARLSRHRALAMHIHHGNKPLAMQNPLSRDIHLSLRP